MVRSRIKNLLVQACPPFLWAIVTYISRRRWREKKDESKQYYGLQELDRKIEAHLDFDGGFFIEIGGWDGVTFSNSLYFERYRGWRGILIEPSPNEFLKCRKNRPEAAVYCYACVPFGYQEKFVHMTYCASMTVVNSPHIGLGDHQSHVESGKKFLAEDETVFEFGAVAKTLSEILNENEIKEVVDLLILDVEGFELNVLQGIDFERHAPKFICVEVWELDTVDEFLRSKGYQMIDKLSYHDYLYSLDQSSVSRSLVNGDL